MSIEAQLAAYRAKKEKERQAEKPFYRRIFAHGQIQKKETDVQCDAPKLAEVTPSSTQTAADRSSQGHHSAEESADQLHHYQSSCKDYKYYLTLGLKICLWLVLWKFFIEVGFGAVYFIASGFILMWFNTGTGPRDGNRLSAYSVFNPNQERLDGTFTSEQFERELRFGPTSVN